MADKVLRAIQIVQDDDGWWKMTISGPEFDPPHETEHPALYDALEEAATETDDVVEWQ